MRRGEIQEGSRDDENLTAVEDRLTAWIVEQKEYGADNEILISAMSFKTFDVSMSVCRNCAYGDSTASDDDFTLPIALNACRFVIGAMLLRMKLYFPELTYEPDDTDKLSTAMLERFVELCD